MRVAGFGFRNGATLDSLRAVLAQVEAAGGPAEALASLPAKTCAPALQLLAQERKLPVLTVVVAGVVTPTQSARIVLLHGCGSVAEAAALAGAGAGAVLTVARAASGDGMATCAMAAGDGPADGLDQTGVSG